MQMSVMKKYFHRRERRGTQRKRVWFLIFLCDPLRPLRFIFCHVHSQIAVSIKIISSARLHCTSKFVAQSHTRAKKKNAQRELISNNSLCAFWFSCFANFRREAIR